MSRYEDAEKAMVERLTATVGETASPFREASVLHYGSQMTDADLLDEVEKLRTLAPAALVYYAGSEFGGTFVLDESAQFNVIVVAAGISRTAVNQAASTGVYDLLELVRDRLHNYRDSEGQIFNPLQCVRHQRFLAADRPATVAAMVAVFEQRLERAVSS